MSAIQKYKREAREQRERADAVEAELRELRLKVSALRDLAVAPLSTYAVLYGVIERRWPGLLPGRADG